ncbi:MAG: acetylxylan esterase [Leptospiraceae bacterium]
MASRKPTFDDCYQALPELTPPRNLDKFWQDLILNLKRLPVEPQQKLVLKKSFGKESLSDIAFQSLGPTVIRGQLFLPRRRGKAPVVIHFPDYDEKASFPGAVKDYSRSLTEKGIALLSVNLRKPPETTRVVRTTATTTRASGSHSGAATATSTAAVEVPVPPLLAMGLDPIEKSYLAHCYLDALRAVDFLRLQKGIDSGKIALLGRGLGAAMASFVAHMRKESVVGLSLERPSPAWISRWLDDSTGSMAEQIREMMRQKSGSRAKWKKSLELLDPINWAQSIQVPVLFSAGLEDRVHPPMSVFGFFNHLQTEKAMQFFTDEEQDPTGKKERLTSLDFLVEQLNP